MKNRIEKFIANSITEDELKLLYKWLEKPENQNKFEQYIVDYHDLNLATLKNDVDAAYGKVNSAIRINKRKSGKIIPLYKRKFIKYAAAVLVILTTSFFFLAKDTFDENTGVSIQPGTNQATLTLADGSQVILDSLSNFQNNSISGTGKEIRYKNSDGNTEDIEYNYLTIPGGGQYHLVLSDNTEVWLNSETKIKYPVYFKTGQTRNVELLFGEAYFNVSPSTNHQGTSFKVLTRGQDIEVLGTEFNIKAYKDEMHMYSTLVEGKIAVSTPNQKRVLQPGEQSVVVNNTITIKNVDVFNETAWRKGVFSFKDMPLKNIMKVLSRWYNVNVSFDNKALENETFTGVLGREQSLQEILFIISDINKIEYKINNNTVLLK